MDTSQIFALLPTSLRNELMDAFSNIVKNFHEGRWEPSELDGGKFCEVVYSIIRGYADGTFPSTSSKPPNMALACQQMENAATTLPRSIRILIPRFLVPLYEVRNNRGVGHVGSEVNPNFMDATMVLYTSKWILAELIRIFHNTDIKTATEAVEILMERETPLVWNINDKKRVMSLKFTMRQKVLLLLNSEVSSVDESDLLSWTEHSNTAIFRRDILKPMHKQLLIDYDQTTKKITLSPKGSDEAQKLFQGNF